MRAGTVPGDTDSPDQGPQVTAWLDQSRGPRRARAARPEWPAGDFLVCSPRRPVAAVGETGGVGGNQEEGRETAGWGVTGTQSKEMGDCSIGKLFLV